MGSNDLHDLGYKIGGIVDIAHVQGKIHLRYVHEAAPA